MRCSILFILVLWVVLPDCSQAYDDISLSLGEAEHLAQARAALDAALEIAPPREQESAS